MSGRKLPVLPTLTDPQSDDLIYAVDVSDTSESPQGTSKQMEFGTLLSSGTFTLTPVVTAGSGSVDDFNFDYIKIGSKVSLSFLCRSYIISVGEATTTVELDLTGTDIEPAANFSGGFDYTGGVNIGSYTTAGNMVYGAAISTVSGEKKLQISIGTAANVTGQDFDNLVGGTIVIDA